MSDHVYPTYPVTRRRGRRRRLQVDRHVLERIREAVAVPLVTVVLVLGAAVIAGEFLPVPARYVLLVSVCGLVVAAVVGARRADAAAVAVQRAQEAGLQAIADAASAVEKSVAWAADELCRGGRPPIPDNPPAGGGVGPAAGVVALLGGLQVQAAAALNRVHDESQSAVLLEMLREMSRREHTLVGRALEALDELQMELDDPVLLDQIWAIDHLVTRMRRLVESKAVLGGESLRSVREPVSVQDVLRGGVSEVVQYQRVVVVPDVVGGELGLPGHVGPDVSHLLAELIENATEFSSPTKKVQVRVEKVATGLAVEVEDRALPMRRDLRARMNALLADPDQADVRTQVREGRIGLLTAAKIARRHGIAVQMSSNPTGGTTALVVVPDRHLVSMRPPGAVRPPVPAHPRPQSAAPVGCEQSAHASATSRRPADAPPPLPQRSRGQMPAPDVVHRPPVPATAARPGLAAAFRDGMHAARSQEPPAATASPQALDHHGGSSAVHL
ncbi:ATP-binding protein [Streptomyces sp. NPDC127105]|uniref:ATP-binding protein n=1 Tax=Streptomyces sp. NPDC127105 TaxID=3345359 RepID=UPI003649972D